MSLFRRSRPSEESVAAAVTTAVGARPGEVAYNHLQYRGGALSGTLEVDDRAAFAAALEASYAALARVLGDDADRVVVYLVGHTPAGATVGPADLGLPERPSGRDIARAVNPGKSTLEGEGEEA